MKHLLDKNFISSVKASTIAGVSRPTIIKWCVDFKIGRKIAGSWHIDEKSLKKVLNGELVYGTKKKKSK
jgi:hypothetical protein